MIKTSVASNLRKPGTYQEFDAVSGSKGLVPLTQRVALIGMKTAAGAGAVATPTQIFTEKDAEDFAGQGSELSLMARAALKASNFYVNKYGGGQPEIWLVAVADPAGTAATKTLTVTGPATAAGDLVLRIAGRTIRVGVAIGDTATQVATKIVDAVKAKYSDLPYTAGSAAGVATLTARHLSVWGNDIRVTQVGAAPAGIVVVIATGVAGVGAYDITASLDTLADKRYDSVAIGNHTSTDVSDLKAYVDARNAPGVKAYSLGHIGETGSIATATGLATGSNYKELFIHESENGRDLPGEIAAMVAATIESETDPARSFDYTEIPLYGPENVADVFTNAEIETLLAAGVTPLVLNDTQDRSAIVRLVTTKTTEASLPFENLLDASNVRSMFYAAVQVDAAWRRAFQRSKKNARTIKRVRSVTLEVLRKLEELEILQNVEQHAAELKVETDTIVPTRINVEIPLAVVPNLHQLVGKHVLQIE